MPLIRYFPEEWAWLLSTQKISICKHHAKTTDCGQKGSGGGYDNQQHENCYKKERPKSDKFWAIVLSVATLSKNVNVMAI